MPASRPAGRLQEEPLVSIIVPVYNVRPYLPQCVESLLRQTYPKTEILLIDDGSTDGCGSLCDDYARRDARVRVLHTESRGLSSARNLGLEQAKGAYLSFVDSDDWIELPAIETMLATALQTDADIVVAGATTEYVGKSVPSLGGEERMQILQGFELLSAYSKGLLLDVVWNKLYRKECFSALRFPDGHNYEDVATTPKLMRALAEQGGRIALLPEDLFHFRMRKSSITHTWTPANILDSWTAYREKYETMPDPAARFLFACFRPIGRMWLSYGKFSEEDKKRTKATLREMQTFSKAHGKQVLTGKAPHFTKAACLVSLSRGPLTMWICCRAGQIRQRFRKTEKLLFD